MQISLNPYIAGNPVGGTPNFIGRADVLREVLRVMRQPHQNIIVLYGQRRIGKTSVLQQLAAQLPNEGTYYPVYFDLQDKASWPLGRVLTDLARVLSYELIQQGPPSLKQTGPLLSDEDPVKAFQETWLPATLDRLPEGHSIVLLFDEFDVLADPKGGQAGSDLFPYLRGLLATDPNRLQFAFVIGRKVEDLESIALSLFKGAPALRVSLLNKVDTFELVRLSERNETLRWSDDSLEKVWDLTHGHPFLTQQLCSRLWENLYDTDPTGIPTVIPEDVDEAISETLEASRNTLEWLWDGLPPAERVVISALAGAGNRAITRPQLEQLLRESGVRVVIRELQNAPQLLQDWDLIEPVEDGYRFRVELFRRWILEHKPLSRVQEELDRIEPLAENLYQAAYGFFRSNQLEDAMPLLRQAIGLNPNHARSRQLLAEIFLLRGEVDQAVQILQLLYDTQPAVARPRLVQALLLKAEEETNEEQRLAVYQQILLIDPTHPVASQKVAEIQRTNRQRELAQRQEELYKAEKEKHYREALEIARQVAEKYPDERDWQPDLDRLERKTKLAEDYQRAIGAWNSGDRDTALRGLADVIALEPDYEEATRYLHLAKTGQDAVQLASQLAGEQKAHNRVKVKLDEESLTRTETEKQRDELQIRLEGEREHSEARQRIARRNLYWAIGSSFVALALLVAWAIWGTSKLGELNTVQTELAELQTTLTEMMEETPVAERFTETPTESIAATDTDTVHPTETLDVSDMTTEPSPTLIETPTPAPTEIPTLDPFAGLVIEDGQATLRLGKGELFDAEISADGEIIAIASSTGIYVYEAQSFEPLWSVATSSRVKSIAISGNGVLAAGLEDGVVMLRDANDGSDLQPLEGHEESVNAVTFSPDGFFLATGSVDGMLFLWNVQDHELISNWQGHEHGISALAFSLDNISLASGADDNQVILWNLDNPENPDSLEPYATNATVWSLAWSSENILAWGLEDGGVEIWDFEASEITALAGHASAVKSISWSPEEELVTGSDDGDIIFWNLNTQEPKKTFTDDFFPFLSLMWDSDGKLVSATREGLQRWDLEAGHPDQILSGFTSPINDIAFSPDGTRIASGSDDGLARLWDASTGGQIRILSGHTYSITSVAFSPDGQTLAGTSWDQSIILWNVETGDSIGEPIRQTSPILSVAFSPADNNLLAFGTADSQVVIWNLASGTPNFQLNGHESAINTLDYSFDGRFLASGSDGGVIIIWDTGSGRILFTLGDNEPGHTAQVFSVMFTANAIFLGSASADSSIIVWDFPGEEQSDKSTLDETVWALTFSTDGWMAAGLLDGSIFMWQLANFPNNNEPQVVLMQHHRDVTSLAFSPDGSTLASGSKDGTIILWNMSEIAP